MPYTLASTTVYSSGWVVDESSGLCPRPSEQGQRASARDQRVFSLSLSLCPRYSLSLSLSLCPRYSLSLSLSARDASARDQRVCSQPLPLGARGKHTLRQSLGSQRHRSRRQWGFMSHTRGSLRLTWVRSRQFVPDVGWLGIGDPAPAGVLLAPARNSRMAHLGEGGW